MRISSQESISASAIPFPCELQAGGRPRILYYSPESWGLGPVSRQMMLARSICDAIPGAAILWIGEARQGSTPILPPGVEYLALPPLASSETKRRIPPSELADLRHKLLFATVQCFNPDVLLIEQPPNTGSTDEIDQILEHSACNGRRPCTVLILQDTIADPSARFELESIIRKTYDFAWVLGDPAILNWVREYGLSLDLLSKLRYAGYPDHRLRAQWFEQEGKHGMDLLGLPAGHLVLCLAGEGEAGETLAEVFSRVHLPPKTNGVIACGSSFSSSVRQKLQRRLAGYPRMRLIEVNHDYAWLLSAAERIIAIGSYNTVSEILSFEKRGFVFLQTACNGDATRAQIFRKLELLEFSAEDTITPDPLSRWLSIEMSITSGARRSVSLNALNLIPKLLQEAILSPKIATS